MSRRQPQITVLLLLAVLASAGWSGDPWTDRRERIEAMSPAEKEELRHRQERFSALTPVEQQRIRRLHLDLEADPDADHLRDVMSRYHRWLTTLSSYHRAELLQLEPAERVKRIKTMLDEQSQREAKRLGPQDLAALTAWMEQYAKRYETRFLETAPEGQRQNYQKAAPSARPRILFGIVWWRWQRWNSPKLPIMTEEEIVELKAAISPEARKHLEGKPPCGAANRRRRVDSPSNSTADGRLGYEVPSRH